MRKERVWYVLAGLLLVACSAPFIRAWDYGLINLDDYDYLTGHVLVYEWNGLGSVSHFLTDVREGIWMPLTWFSYALDYMLFGDWYGGFHLHSIAIHLVNSALVLTLLVGLFGEMQPWRGRRRTLVFVCLLSTLFWSIHPLRCESVVALSSRKDVLSLFWELLAIVCWAKGGPLRTLWACIFFVLGSMCKPSVMTFPVICLLIDTFVKREIRPLRYVAPVTIAIFLMFFASWQQYVGGATVDFSHRPLWGRALGACAAFGIYLKNTICPTALAPQCLVRWPEWPRFWLAGLIASLAWCWWLVRQVQGLWALRGKCVDIQKSADGFPVRLAFDIRENPVFVGMAWFLVVLFPMLGIANFGYHAFADRFTYIPAIGLSVLIVPAVGWLLDKTNGRVVALLGTVIVAGLSFLCWKQTGYWSDDHRLFSRTLEVDGEKNVFAHNVLAGWYFEHPHQLGKCIYHFEKAAEANITGILSSYALYVFALCENGQVDEAGKRIHDFEKAVERFYGEGMACRILSCRREFTRLPPARFIHLCSKLAIWINTPECLQTAEEFVLELENEIDRKNPVWIYLRMRLAERMKDQALAQKLRNELKAAPRSYGYLRFRYLFDQGTDMHETD